MSIRKKTMLMLFVDYLLSILIQLFGLFVLSWMLDYSWGFCAYSVIFTLVLFGMLYSRVHNAADKALKRKELKPATEGLIMAAPLAIFNLVVILFFALVKSNLLPIGDAVMNTVYTFPDNQPRVETHVLFIEYLTMIIRVWFGFLVGFSR
ncbi:MAG: hypothetical protein IKL80_01790, partial [Clostridia bacterium]|nr:hypothetical protein [Clostridia bacterium]